MTGRGQDTWVLVPLLTHRVPGPRAHVTFDTQVQLARALSAQSSRTDAANNSYQPATN